MKINLDQIARIVDGAIALAEGIVALTPSTKDDAFIARLKAWREKVRPLVGTGETVEVAALPADVLALMENYFALCGVLESELAIKDTHALGEIQARAKQAAYGTRNPFDFAEYENLLFGEALERGLLGADDDGDGKPGQPIEVDRQAWLQFYGEVIEGLQRE